MVMAAEAMARGVSGSWQRWRSIRLRARSPAPNHTRYYAPPPRCSLSLPLALPVLLPVLLLLLLLAVQMR